LGRGFEPHPPHAWTGTPEFEKVVVTGTGALLRPIELTSREPVMIKRLVTVLALGLALVAPAPAATADTRTFRDDARTAGPMDIRSVSVRNEQRLTLRIVVDDLQRRPGRSASAWIDTDPRRPGPEYVIGSGLFDSDWQISRARNWKVAGDGPLSCPVGQTLVYDRDVIRWTTGTRCLGRYSSVRVSFATRGSGGATDASPARRTLHPRVARF
jgi:hypothetical protein